MTVIAYERHPVAPGREDEYTALLHELVTALRGRPGALWADAAAAFDDAPSFVVLSEWRTPADLDAWETTPEAEDLADRAAPWLREAPTRRRLTPQT